MSILKHFVSILIYWVYQNLRNKIFYERDFLKRVSKSIEERRQIYATLDFSDKYGFALFKYPFKIVKLLILEILLILNKFSI
jgi:hypothetical protein